MTLTGSIGSAREAREMRVCVCGHYSGTHIGGVGKCLVNVGEDILACACTEFTTHDSQPLDVTRFPEGAEI